MLDINKVIIVGRLGREPELKETKNGHPFAVLSVATHARPYKNGEGEEVQNTQWHKVVTWGKQAQNCSHYLFKGAAIYLEGQIRSRHYSDRNGNDQISYEIHADQVSFLTPMPDSERESRDEIPVLSH